MTGGIDLCEWGEEEIQVRRQEVINKDEQVNGQRGSSYI